MSLRTCYHLSLVPNILCLVILIYLSSWGITCSSCMPSKRILLSCQKSNCGYFDCIQHVYRMVDGIFRVYKNDESKFALQSYRALSFVYIQMSKWWHSCICVLCPLLAMPNFIVFCNFYQICKVFVWSTIIVQFIFLVWRNSVYRLWRGLSSTWCHHLFHRHASHLKDHLPWQCANIVSPSSQTIRAGLCFCSVCSMQIHVVEHNVCI